MSAQPVTPGPTAATPPPGTSVTALPEVVIEEGRFEGKEVGSTLITLAGSAKLTPQSIKHDDTVLTTDDIATIQLDVKVGDIHFVTDGNGVLSRVQKVRPIEGTVTVVDVIRRHDTRIR